MFTVQSDAPNGKITWSKLQFLRQIKQFSESKGCLIWSGLDLDHIYRFYHSCIEMTLIKQSYTEEC